MPDQKADTLLNIALEMTPEERAKVEDINAGYNEESNTWNLIVKYNSDLEDILAITEDVVELLNQYLIVTIKEENIERLLNIAGIEYVEKPKGLIFSADTAKEASCINNVSDRLDNLRGQGTIAAVIDSGVDYTHRDFRNEDGSTRILYLWDETVEGNPPEGYNIGTEYTTMDINRALESTNPIERRRIVRTTDPTGHGTHVLGIVAGNGIASDGKYAGVAPECDIIFVKLRTPEEGSFPTTIELMLAADYCARKSNELGVPMAINMSFGNNYGSHDGNSLIENYLDDLALSFRGVIVTGTGNEGTMSRHAAGVLRAGITEVIEYSIPEGETSLDIQIWKDYADIYEISIITASDRKVVPQRESGTVHKFNVENTEILVYYGAPTPYNPLEEIFIQYIPREDYIESGIWRIEMRAVKLVTGIYNMWMPAGAQINLNTFFLNPSKETTLTIPSTARRVISVAAYNQYTGAYADFSGRGYTANNQLKPDIAAPGFNVISASPGGGYTAKSGTSMAAPVVSGGALLLMEWGEGVIIRLS